MKTIFISDTHIGISDPKLPNDCPENWYQMNDQYYLNGRELHQQYLQDVLEYIAQQDDVEDVVLLGDWFDTWMYPADVMPPGIKEILDANPALFTQQGHGNDFISCAQRIKGKFYYIRGNHDMTIDEDYLKTYLECQGVSNFICADSYCVNKIYAAHGHAYDVFCRPDKDSNQVNNPYWPLPIGYFISRTVALFCKNHYLHDHENQTVADLVADGNPDWKVLFKNVIEALLQLQENSNLTIDFAKLIMTVLADLTRMTTEQLKFIMPDGKTFTATEVMKWFPKIFYDEIDIALFLQVDLAQSLSLMAGDLCNQYKYDVVVFGHTHIPVIQSGFSLFTMSKTVYSNCGFMCPAIPDLQKNQAKMTFVEVTRNAGEKFTVQEMAVNYAPNDCGNDGRIFCQKSAAAG